MVTFRNNRRGRFRGGDRNYKRNNGESNKFKSDFSTNNNFQRKSPGRNNHNAPKLIEKYNDLAREALANGDKILSENYFQHADHFTRIMEEQSKKKTFKVSENSHSSDIKKDNLEDSQDKEKQSVTS
tara:strand:+ start:258 stop:638 length:381 start_codon:yes stop_codon:yes gene_type:complete